MRIAALDLSSKTGWAVHDGKRHAPLLGTKQLVGWGYDTGSMLEHWRLWLGEFFKAHDPELVAIEAWMLPQHGDGRTILKQAGLLGFTEWCCKISGRKVEIVYAASWRKTFLGSAHGKTDELKQKSLEACRALGWNPPDHNAADAAGVLHHAIDAIAKVQSPWRDAHLFYIQSGKPKR